LFFNISYFRGNTQTFTYCYERCRGNLQRLTPHRTQSGKVSRQSYRSSITLLTVSQKKDKKISISHLAFGAIDIYNRLVVDSVTVGRNSQTVGNSTKNLNISPNKISNQQLIGQVASVALAVKSIIRMISKFVFKNVAFLYYVM
jgi:hypothetical protein